MPVTITVNIKPEVQAELARRAASHGSPIEAYAANLSGAFVDAKDSRSEA